MADIKAAASRPGAQAPGKALEELVATLHRLKEENRALRQRQDSLRRRNTVMNRSEQVRARVEGDDRAPQGMEHTA